MGKMKNRKAAGDDMIPTEIRKSTGEDGILWMREIINKCGDEGRAPTEWNKSVLCPIFKKGDKTDCRNYRGIALMLHIAKVYERILERRLREIVENRLEELQYGFRPNRSTIYLIFSLKMICEKSWEFNRKAHVAFIDLEKAFDRVPRNVLWNILGKREYEVPSKLIGAIKSTYVNSVCKVKTQTDSNDWFRIETGVKQGSVLSPLLFIIFMDYCGRLVRRETNGEILGYADDLALIAETGEALQNFVAVWDEVLNAKGMKISKEKTEVMLLSKEQEEMDVVIGGSVLKQVDWFEYLGVYFGTGNDMILELNHRISKFNGTLALLYPLLKDRNIPRKVKMIIYTNILRPILIYGHEAWALNTRLKSKLQTCEMRVLRVIMGVTRLDRLRNSDIRRELGVESLLTLIEKGQLRWFGHLKRMNNNRYARRYYEWTPLEGRGVGRPKIRWSDNIKTAVERRGGTMEEIEEMAYYEDQQ